jgi:hypothetical protein
MSVPRAATLRYGPGAIDNLWMHCSVSIFRDRTLFKICSIGENIVKEQELLALALAGITHGNEIRTAQFVFSFHSETSASWKLSASLHVIM